MTKQNPDYDSPWKEIIEIYFEEFMAFFFPKAHGKIDWSAGYTFMDKELQKVARDAETGRRVVDKLARITRLDGDEAFVLAHIEVQGSPKPGFANACMFTITGCLTIMATRSPVLQF